jgi:hypothetical protein
VNEIGEGGRLDTDHVGRRRRVEHTNQPPLARPQREAGPTRAEDRDATTTANLQIRSRDASLLIVGIQVFCCAPQSPKCGLPVGVCSSSWIEAWMEIVLQSRKRCEGGKGSTTLPIAKTPA